MKFFNTLTNSIENLTPKNKTVNLYICGITPYSSTHLGHAMSYVIFDVLRRFLEHSGYKVRHIQNFTDVDDKIIAAANSKNITINELAEKYISEYFTLMEALNIQRAHFYPKATEEIPEIIKFISVLIEKGFAYESEGNVFFKVSKFKEYGKLSNRKIEDMLIGARIEVDHNKIDPLDFVLWKASKNNEPYWESPWSNGRPGWHIECSAMCLKYCPDGPDIHGGGQDLIFPHHENEITQSEAFGIKPPFASIWIHNGLLQLQNEKMSKSTGNLITLDEALKKYGPNALRYFFLSSHYRSPLSFNEEFLAQSKTGIQRIENALHLESNGDNNNIEIKHFENEFFEHMKEDLNTPRALSVIFELVKEINKQKTANNNILNHQKLLSTMCAILGFTFDKNNSNISNDETIDSLIQVLIEIRTELRSKKDFELADTIRKKLSKIGFNLEDTKEKTIWSKD